MDGYILYDNILLRYLYKKSSYIKVVISPLRKYYNVKHNNYTKVVIILFLNTKK